MLVGSLYFLRTTSVTCCTCVGMYTWQQYSCPHAMGEVRDSRLYMYDWCPTCVWGRVCGQAKWIVLSDSWVLLPSKPVVQVGVQALFATTYIVGHPTTYHDSKEGPVFNYNIFLFSFLIYICLTYCSWKLNVHLIWPAADFVWSPVEMVWSVYMLILDRNREFADRQLSVV